MKKEYAIIDNRGIIYSGDYEFIKEIWDEKDYKKVETEGDVLLVEILERRH